MNDLRISPELIERIASRDAGAMAELYDCAAPVLYSTCDRVLGDRREAEDVLQDVFIQVWEKAGGYDSKLGSPLSWLLVIARNKAIERLRNARRRIRITENSRHSLPKLINPAGVEQVLVGRETTAMLRSAVDLLSTKQRRVLELAFFEGLSHQQIADALEEPLGTIKARARRGLLMLQKRLKESRCELA